MEKAESEGARSAAESEVTELKDNEFKNRSSAGTRVKDVYCTAQNITRSAPRYHIRCLRIEVNPEPDPLMKELNLSFRP